MRWVLLTCVEGEHKWLFYKLRLYSLHDIIKAWTIAKRTYDAFPYFMSYDKYTTLNVHKKHFNIQIVTKDNIHSIRVKGIIFMEQSCPTFISVTVVTCAFHSFLDRIWAQTCSNGFEKLTFPINYALLPSVTSFFF